MAKIRETKLVTRVLGYSKKNSFLSDKNIPIRVEFTGTGPLGRISGEALVSPESYGGFCEVKGIGLTGSGRYSFMHGNHALMNSDSFAETVRTVAREVADAWLKENPSALKAARIQWAEESVERAKERLQAAHNTVSTRIEELSMASNELTRLKGE